MASESHLPTIPSRSLAKAEADYETALARLRELGHEPNVYRNEPNVEHVKFATSDEPVLTRHLYDTITALVGLAADGLEARERDAVCVKDRLNVVEGQISIERGEFYLAEFEERYRHGDLK